MQVQDVSNAPQETPPSQDWDIQLHLVYIVPQLLTDDTDFLFLNDHPALGIDKIISEENTAGMSLCYRKNT